MRKRPEWTTFVKETTITSGDGSSPGSTDKTIAKIGPTKHKWDGTLLEFRPAEEYVRRFGGYFSGEERLTFTPNGNATRVEWNVDYTPVALPDFLGALSVLIAHELLTWPAQ